MWNFLFPLAAAEVYKATGHIAQFRELEEWREDNDSYFTNTLGLNSSEPTNIDFVSSLTPGRFSQVSVKQILF